MPTLTVGKNEAGQRLDRFLRKLLPGMPMSHIYKLLRTRKVRVNGKHPQVDKLLKPGDRIIIHMDEARFTQDAKRPKRKTGKLTFKIVFEDDLLLVVSKPPGLAVHGGKGHEKDSLINQVHNYLEVPDRPSAFRPSLAHRIDRDTSGLLLIGKTLEVLRNLSQMLKNRQINKYYLALVRGAPEPAHGTWRYAVQRRDLPGFDKSNHSEEDKTGLTQYQVAATRNLRVAPRSNIQVSLLTLRLLTGRTHQIRSHLLQAGHPLAGDRRYGETGFNRMLKKHYNLGRQFLHAYRLELNHPATGKPITWTDGYPDDLQPLVRSLRLDIPTDTNQFAP